MKQSALPGIEPGKSIGVDRMTRRGYEEKYRAKNAATLRERQRLAHPRRRDAEPEKFFLKGRASHLKKLYGMTIAQYDAMHSAQGGVCAICSKPETRKQKDKLLPLVVDHNHETGRVRALLCHRCNSVVGYSGENVETLRAAARYLERF